MSEIDGQNRALSLLMSQQFDRYAQCAMRLPATGMTIRILRPPPSRMLEGIDLGPYRFETGRVYELEPRVADVLVLWNYAERVSHEPAADIDRHFA
jgi:hypothetical protein